ALPRDRDRPLRALRTISGSAAKFLERGDYGTVRANLDTIIGLVERMGRITGALKSFARKSGTGKRQARLAEAVDNALFLLQTRVDAVQPELQRDIDPTLAVVCDPNRLEQWLVNLLGNALDA